MAVVPFGQSEAGGSVPPSTGSGCARAATGPGAQRVPRHPVCKPPLQRRHARFTGWHSDTQVNIPLPLEVTITHFRGTGGPVPWPAPRFPRPPLAGRASAQLKLVPPGSPQVPGSRVSQSRLHRGPGVGEWGGPGNHLGRPWHPAAPGRGGVGVLTARRPACPGPQAALPL